MRRRRVVLGAAVALLAAVLWRAGGDRPPPPGPSRANFDRLRAGMSLAEAEAVLGPAGPSYSSDLRRDYYIWKGPDGWSYVWVVGGQVVRLEFDADRAAGQ